MAVYRYVTNGAVVEFFTSCSRRERDDLLKYLNLIANDPFQRGDYVQTIRQGREVQVKRFGKWLVAYWADHPVLEVRIVDIERVS